MRREVISSAIRYLPREMWIVFVFSMTAVGALLFATGTAAASANPYPGLTVGSGPTLLQQGEPIRVFGVNYMDAFYRTLKNPSNTTYRQGFAALKSKGIRVIRFSCGGYWPSEWSLYFSNKEEYFARLDAFVQAAQDAGMGLVPSLFWAYFTLPDLVHEPCNRWGDSNSATISLMKQYTRDVVARYKDSPAIWAWEFGNEYNSMVDLPNADQFRPPVRMSLGNPATRSHEDDLYTDMLLTAFVEFAQTVRTIDVTRPITTGNALPRESAEHLRASLSWTTDSQNEFKKNLIDLTPTPMDLISIHYYPQNNGPRFDGTVQPLSTILKLCEEASISSGKALFLGEFGTSTALGGTDATTRSMFAAAASDIAQSSLPIALAWVYDFSAQSADWNITPTNGRAYMLDELAHGNSLMAETVKLHSNTGVVVAVDSGVELTAPSGSFYQWYRNGSLLPGQTDRVLSLGSVRMDDSGSYTCTYTNEHGFRLMTLSRWLAVGASVPAVGLTGLALMGGAVLIAAFVLTRRSYRSN